MLSSDEEDSDTWDELLSADESSLDMELESSEEDSDDEDAGS
jgi:hypothetical protein